jgi:hypothetical protein
MLQSTNIAVKSNEAKVFGESVLVAFLLDQKRASPETRELKF